jgi:hypothetical protein
MESTRYYCQTLKKLTFCEQIFEKKNTFKLEFYENPYSGSRVFQCLSADMKKLIVAFRNFNKRA